MSSLSEWISASDLDNNVKDMLCVAAKENEYYAFIYPNDAHIKAILDEQITRPEKLRLTHVLFIKQMDSANVFTADGSTFTVLYEKSDSICIKNSDQVSFILSKKSEEPKVWSLSSEGNKLIGDNTYAVNSSSKTGGESLLPFTISSGLNMMENFSTSIENAYVENSKTAGLNPYLGAVTSFLRYLEGVNSERSISLLERIIPLMDANPMISFYIIFQPYKRTGKYFVDRSYIFDKNNVLNFSLNAFGEDAETEYKRLLCYKPNQNRKAYSAKVFSNPTSVKAEVDRICQNLHNIVRAAHGPTAEILIADVKEIYTTLSTKNMLGNLINVFPDITMFEEEDQLLWVDELKFWATEFVKKMDNNSPEKFTQMICSLREIFPGNNYAQELTVHNTSDNRCDNSQSVAKFALGQFVKEAFMTTALEKNYATTGGALHNSRVKLNNMKNRYGISGQALNELKSYVRSHGKLPHAVTDLL
jgi:hypothetical protein